MYKMRDGWTDERMDDFRDEVNRRFDAVDKRFDKFEGDVDRRFDAVDKRFDKVDKRFDKVEGEVRELRSEMKSGFEGLYRVQFVVGGGIVAALLGVIATQI
jgi:tetrahydromethanopterin S-methyltransferase subunit G